MEKGIIYVMTTVVPGLIKIGKTGLDNFEQHMYLLERNGYDNIAGLHRRFAIEVDNYSEKETKLHDIFAKSRVPNSELFFLDAELVVQLLSSLEGRQIYPEPSEETKEETFEEAAREREDSRGWDFVPDGTYHLSHTIRGIGKIEATMRVEGGSFIVCKGSTCSSDRHYDSKTPAIVRTAIIVNNVLQEDVLCPSPSAAGWIVLNKSNDGWKEWKNAAGEPIDVYRSR